MFREIWLLGRWSEGGGGGVEREREMGRERGRERDRERDREGKMGHQR